MPKVLNIFTHFTLPAVWLIASCAAPPAEMKTRDRVTIGSANNVQDNSDNNPAEADGTGANSSGDSPASSSNSDDSNTLIFQWDAPQDEVASYQLYAKEQSTSLDQIIAEIATDAATFNLANPRFEIKFRLNPVLSSLSGKKVCFYLIAANATGASEASDEVCVDSL